MHFDPNIVTREVALFKMVNIKGNFQLCGSISGCYQGLFPLAEAPATTKVATQG